ncbi:hypothetical protein CHR28_08940 [Streptomyces sp. XY006]|nr:hypothetical protein CHR28_08940 [Streptomyces sp. XY006]
MITDAMWDRIGPLMPADPVRGRRWADHRRTLDATARKYRPNSSCPDLPDGSDTGGETRASDGLSRNHSHGTALEACCRRP